VPFSARAMEAHKLLSEFGRNTPAKWPLDRLIAAIRADRAFAGKFAAAALGRAAPEGTYFDLVLGHVRAPVFAALIATALDQIEQGKSTGNAQSVIARASLQFPRLLHPHLPRIFRLRINGDTYYENWPWRESWSSSRDHLLATVDGSRVKAERRKAWDCLLECRTAESLRAAAARARRLANGRAIESSFEDVGFRSATAPLFAAQAHHLVFAPNYFRDAPRPWMSRDLHPTWRLPARGRRHRFGGLADGECGRCHGRLHHLITLPAELLQARRSGTVCLATCISCLSEQPTLHYRHDRSGNPVSLDAGERTPDFPAAPLAETFVRLAPTPARWRWQDWALSDGRENLSRVGGYPSWIQDAEFPRCAKCSQPMRFVAQLDSGLPAADGRATLWAGGGMCYVFWCGACRVSGFGIQAT
jgi:hypothetical protein